MVTEEALPSYMNMLNLLDETRDDSGASSEPWASWTRAWTGEENRHGDLLNRYLYLSGRVDMHAVEGSIQRLISRGLNPQLENNPYLCFVYTSFQVGHDAAQCFSVMCIMQDVVCIEYDVPCIMLRNLPMSALYAVLLSFMTQSRDLYEDGEQ
jgi:hypothetical protein